MRLTTWKNTHPGDVLVARDIDVGVLLVIYVIPISGACVRLRFVRLDAGRPLVLEVDLPANSGPDLTKWKIVSRA